MADFLQTLIIAITLGSLYALIALGYTMVYGILKLINFAHSDVVVLGGWISVTAATFFLPRWFADPANPPWFAGGIVLLMAMAVCGLVGFTIERLAYRPLRKAPRLNVLITAIGVSLFLQNAGQLQYTILPSQKLISSGTVLERGEDPKTIKLSSPIDLSEGYFYNLRLISESGSGAQRRIVMSPGNYPAETLLTLDSTVGRASTTNAKFELIRESPYPPLKLPFGKMPAGVPKLIEDRNVVEMNFNVAGPVIDSQATEMKKTVKVSTIQLAIIGTAVVLMILLELLIYRTRIGTAMRAVSYNFETAGLMGIPVDRIVSFTFVIGTALAAAAGFLLAMNYGQIQQPAHPTWVLLGLKAFVAAVVGGIGNVRGAAVGGFLIAFIQEFSSVYLQKAFAWDNASAYSDVIVFALLIVVLLVKPTGLFGSTVREKV